MKIEEGGRKLKKDVREEEEVEGKKVQELKEMRRILN
jgi:hypothetical protein